MVADNERGVRMTAWMLFALVTFTACGRGQPTQAVTEVPAATIPDTTFFTPPATVDASGETDVTAALNQFFASVTQTSAVGVVRMPVGARYRAEGVVRLMGKTNLTIEGNGTLIFAETDGNGVTPPEDLKHLWPRQRSHLEISGGSNIVIRDLVVRGANPNAGAEEGAYVVTLEGQHGFDVRGVDGLLLDGVTVTDTYGDLLYISGNPALDRWSRNVRVTNSHFERSGRQGIAITGAENVQVLNSFIGDVGRTVIDLEPAAARAGARNILFEGNTFGACRHLLMNSGGKGPNVEDISFVGNQLVGIGLKIRVVAADGSRRSNYRIIDNVSDVPLGLPVAALRFFRVDGIEVRGNHQVLNENRSMTAVHARESCNVTVEGNQFPNAAQIADIETYTCPGA